MVDGSYIPAICRIEYIDFDALKEFMREYKYRTYATRLNQPKYFDHSAIFFGTIYAGILDGLRIANSIDEKLYVGYLQSTGEKYTNYHNGFEDLYEKILDILVDVGFLRPVDSQHGNGIIGYYSIN